MTEPTRLVSMPESELERALLDAGRSYTASSSSRTKTLLALGLAGVATSTAPAAVAATSSTLTKGALSKVAVAVIAIGSVTVPVWRYFQHAKSAQDPRPAPAVHLAAALRAPAAPVESAPVVESTPVAAARGTSVPVEGAAPQRTAAPSVGALHADPRPASAPPLAAELAALDAARTSLSRSDPSAALLALDGYARNFPHGKLRLEAEVLRIAALAKSGQSDTARKRAEAFLRRHPDSVLASRVRGYVGL
jgi:hypothetical protein